MLQCMMMVSKTLYSMVPLTVDRYAMTSVVFCAGTRAGVTGLFIASMRPNAYSV